MRLLLNLDLKVCVITSHLSVILFAFYKSQNLRTCAAGVDLFGGPRASALQELNIPATKTFHKEYNTPACTVEVVDNVHAAVEHINQHGR